MPRLALGIGVSATTSCVPTMPMASEGCCWWSTFEHRDQPFHVPRDERVVGRIELRGAHAGGEAAEQILVVADARCRSDIESVSSDARLQLRFSSSGSARYARSGSRVPNASARQRLDRRRPACRSCGAPRRSGARRARDPARARATGAHQSPCLSASLRASTASGAARSDPSGVDRALVDRGNLRLDRAAAPDTQKNGTARSSRSAMSSLTSVCRGLPVRRRQRREQDLDAASVPFSTSAWMASRWTSGSASVSSGCSSFRPFGAAEFAEQEGRRASHLPVRRVHQLLHGLAAGRAESNQDVAQAAGASARPARSTALRPAARSPPGPWRGRAA